MASLNLAGKASGYVKLKAPDDSSNNPTVELPTESGELALKSDITGGGGGIPEAPVDGKQYARKDADWSEVEASGGGTTPTPEDLVWKKYPKGSDPVTQRNLNIEYTNDNNVPLYVQVCARCGSGRSLTVYIDGEFMGSNGNQSAGTNSGFSTQFFVVPSGSTYKAGAVNDDTTPTFERWHEARMPVAVGTGGKTVAFRGELSANQTVESGKATKVNLNTAPTDTDNALVDGKFNPSVAGYYQVSGTVNQQCSPESTNTVSFLYKNGSLYSWGTNVAETKSAVSTVTDVVYFNGTTDYIELWGRVESTGTCAIHSGETRTHLSAVLVSGGSASGDSIWTEEDGKAVYDGNGMEVSVNGTEAMTINKNGRVTLNQTPSLATTVQQGNVYMNETGALYLSTTSTYSAEEVDKKLAIKDKLIEKLSDRLDKLEKKLKKAK